MSASPFSPYNSLVATPITKRGIGEFALIAPKSWLTTIQAPVAPFTNPGDSITIKTDHVFGTDSASNSYAYLKFALAPNKNKIDVKNSGDKGLKSPVTTLEIFVPGSYAEAHETIQNLVNVPLLVIVKDANCAAGMYYNLGTDCTSAYLDYTFTSSTTDDGNKGFTVTIEYSDSPLIYLPAAALPVK